MYHTYSVSTGENSIFDAIAEFEFFIVAHDNTSCMYIIRNSNLLLLHLKIVVT
jgi:hypothetical protein